MDEKLNVAQALIDRRRAMEARGEKPKVNMSLARALGVEHLVKTDNRYDTDIDRNSKECTDE